MKKLIIIIGLVFVFGLTGQAQTAKCPVGQICPVVECPKTLICLTQVEANKVRENAKELEATKEKVVVLEQGLKDKDKSIQDLKDTNAQNVETLKDRVHKAEVDLATATGKIIEMEADRVRWTAVIDVLVKNSRQKKIGINLF